MKRSELRKIIKEEILLREKFETLSGILSMINLDKFKKFIKKNKKYNSNNLIDVKKAIIGWGKVNNKEFTQSTNHDLNKIAEYIQDVK